MRALGVNGLRLTGKGRHSKADTLALLLLDCFNHTRYEREAKAVNYDMNHCTLLIQFSSVYLATIHYEVQHKKKLSRGKGTRKNHGAYRTWTPSLHKRMQNRKSLHGLMDYIDCLIKLPLNITRCFPYFTLVTRTRRRRHQNQINNMTKDSF